MQTMQRPSVHRPIWVWPAQDCSVRCRFNLAKWLVAKLQIQSTTAQLKICLFGTLIGTPNGSHRCAELGLKGRKASPHRTLSVTCMCLRTQKSLDLQTVRLCWNKGVRQARHQSTSMAHSVWMSILVDLSMSTLLSKMMNMPHTWCSIMMRPTTRSQMWKIASLKPSLNKLLAIGLRRREIGTLSLYRP